MFHGSDCETAVWQSQPAALQSGFSTITVNVRAFAHCKKGAADLTKQTRNTAAWPQSTAISAFSPYVGPLIRQQSLTHNRGHDPLSVVHVNASLSLNERWTSRQHVAIATLPVKKFWIKLKPKISQTCKLALCLRGSLRKIKYIVLVVFLYISATILERLLRA